MKLTEKQKNCPYCHGKIDRSSYLDITPGKEFWRGAAINDHVEYAVCNDSVIAGATAFNYSQMCGRPLSKEG